MTTDRIIIAPTWDAELAAAYTEVRVGDDVTISEDYSYGRKVERSQARTVVKITRQSIIVHSYGGREWKFDIGNGIERRGANSIGSPSRLDSAKTAAMRADRTELLGTLKRYGWMGVQAGPPVVGNYVLLKMVALLEQHRVQ